jgi:hypothetical protein
MKNCWDDHITFFFTAKVWVETRKIDNNWRENIPALSPEWR